MPAKPAAVAAFLSAEAAGGAKASTLGRRCAAIRDAHIAAGYPNPTGDTEVSKVMRGSGAPLAPPRHRKRRRPRIGSLRCWQPYRVALDVLDLEETADGLRVTIRRSKTDQEGQGHVIAILAGAKLRIIEAVKAWIEAAGITEGPIQLGTPEGAGEAQREECAVPLAEQGVRSQRWW